MANPIKGEVAFEAGAQSYTFVFGTYARAALQRRVGKLTTFLERAENGEWGDDDLLAVFHAGLLYHQEGITEREASRIMDDLGMRRVEEIVGEAISLSAPEAAKSTGRPQKAARTKSRTG